MAERRFEFCQKYENIDLEKVIFSDESRNSCQGQNRAQMIRRRSRGLSLDKKYLHPTVKYPISVMSWGCIRYDTLSPLKIISGTMESAKHKNLLSRKLLPFYNQKESSIFQDDSATCHRSKIIKD